MGFTVQPTDASVEGLCIARDYDGRGEDRVLPVKRLEASVGKSAVWAPDGALRAQAEGAEDALVIATNHDPAWDAEVIRM